MRWRALIVSIVLAGPTVANAQSMSGMDHAAMGHDDASASTPAEEEHSAPAHPVAHDDASMSMGAMQGGAAPANARSPDWSDGVAPSKMEDMTMMDMDDTSSVGNLLIDNLESFAGKSDHGQSWEVDGWYGNDTNKLWLRSEGERTGGRPHDGDVEAFWSHAVAAFWDTQLGVRRDIGEGPARTWAAAGIQGLAPYWFEVEATLYAGAGGRTAARVRAEYELRLTQRLILQPELEINAYGKADPRRDIGTGLSSVEGGLRLRYEIRRSFAPYVGVTWEHLAGGTADIARNAGRRITDRRWVAGIRLWF